MTDLHGPLALAPHLRHDIVRRDAGGLVEEQYGVQSCAEISLRRRSISSSSGTSVVKPAAWRWPPPPNWRAVTGPAPGFLGARRGTLPRPPAPGRPPGQPA